MPFPDFFDQVPRITLRDPLAELRVTRTDTGQAVLTQGHAHSVPGDPQTMRLLQLCLSGQASDEQRTAFGQLWQARVRRILLDHAHDDAVFQIKAA